MKVGKTMPMVCLVITILGFVTYLVGFSVVAIIEICTLGASVGPVAFLCLTGLILFVFIGVLLMKMDI